MNIRYDGPSEWVIVEPYGKHTKDEVKEYPDDFGQDLLATSKKQQFSVVDEADPANNPVSPEAMTVAQLKDDLVIFHDETELKGLKKDALVALYTTTRDALIALAQE